MFNAEDFKNLPSLEELKVKYQERLNSILSTQITVENIDIFADQALSELTLLVDNILDDYKNNPQLEANIEISNKEQEDDAFSKLNLPNLQNVLERVIEIKEKIDRLKDYLANDINKTDKTLIPPQPDTRYVETGSGAGIREKKFVPRVLTLLYVLEADFDLTPKDWIITEGAVEEKMMRQTPYVRVKIDAINRVVYVCDEEGNASYVFDTNKLAEFGLEIKDVDMSDKEKLNQIIANHPGVGYRLIQNKNWRSNISGLLEEEIPGVLSEREKQVGEIERKKFLGFSDFQAEVTAIYPDSGDIQKWYVIECKKHPNWPSHPREHYSDSGWSGWPELVGRENRIKKEWPTFEAFQVEVASLYPGQGDIHAWYTQEKSKHKNWPSNPDKKYKDEGWSSWPELIGRENRPKKEWPTFEAFQAEVASLYPGQGDVFAWYSQERIKHLNWPSTPDRAYRNDGWSGWSDLVGKDNPSQKEYPSFDDFRKEVLEVYLGSDDVRRWYEIERKSHSNWPASPYTYYSDSGWSGWPELVGRENRLKKEWPTFEAFQVEVVSLYPGYGDVAKWYRRERTNHSNWPSHPYRIYEGKGWTGWSELVERGNQHTIERPSFEVFKAEVSALYPGQGDVATWYKQERIKHPNWPSHPEMYYKEKGWLGLSALVGKDNPVVKEWPMFGVFQAEVIGLYPGSIGVQRWYKIERTNHSNWPSDPDKVYKDKGWVSWTELVKK